MKYWLIGVLAPLLWGTTYAVTQHWMADIDPLWIAALRVLVPGLLMLPFLPLTVIRQHWHRMLLLGGLNIGIFTVLLFQAISRLPGGVAATLVSTVPLQILLMRWVSGNRPQTASLLASIGGSAGVALLVWRASEPLNPVGVGFALAAGFCMALGMVLTPRYSRGVPPLQMAAGQLFLCGLVLVAAVLSTGRALPEFDSAALMAFIWIAPLGMGVGFYCWFLAMQHIPTDKLSFLGLLNPLIAVGCGVVLMGETLTLMQLLAVGIVLSCVLVAQVKPKQSPAQPSADKAVC